MDPASLHLFESTRSSRGPGTRGKFPLSRGRSTWGWKDPWACRGEEFLLGPQMSPRVVRGGAWYSQHCPRQQLAVLCDKVLWHWGAVIECASRGNDPGGVEQVKLWLQSVFCTEAESPSQAPYRSPHPLGDGELLISFPLQRQKSNPKLWATEHPPFPSPSLRGLF